MFGPGVFGVKMILDLVAENEVLVGADGDHEGIAQ